jgi:hypothetical protein
VTTPSRKEPLPLTSPRLRGRRPFDPVGWATVRAPRRRRQDVVAGTSSRREAAASHWIRPLVDIYAVSEALAEPSRIRPSMTATALARSPRTSNYSHLGLIDEPRQLLVDSGVHRGQHRVSSHDLTSHLAARRPALSRRWCSLQALAWRLINNPGGPTVALARDSAVQVTSCHRPGRPRRGSSASRSRELRPARGRP